MLHLCDIVSSESAIYTDKCQKERISPFDRICYVCRYAVVMTSIQTKGLASATQAIGSTISQHLHLAGITRAELGELLGMTSQNVSGRITGRTKWTGEDLLLVSYMLGVSVDDLMPRPDGHGGWMPAPWRPGNAKAPTEVRALLDSYAIRDSNPGPTD